MSTQRPEATTPDMAVSNRSSYLSSPTPTEELGPMPVQVEAVIDRRRPCRYCHTKTLPQPGLAGRPAVCSVCRRPYNGTKPYYPKTKEQQAS